MRPSLEGLPIKAKEAPSPHEVRLAPLDTNPVFQCLGEKKNLERLTNLCDILVGGYLQTDKKKKTLNFLNIYGT